MDIKQVLDQIDEIIYIADMESYELLYLNRIGREPEPNRTGALGRTFTGCQVL